MAALEEFKALATAKRRAFPARTRQPSIGEFSPMQISRSMTSTKANKLLGLHKKPDVPEKIFLSHLWDKTEVVLDKARQGSNSGKFLEGSLERLEKIEAAYAAELSKWGESVTAGAAEKFTEGKTLTNSLHMFVHMAVHRGTEHAAMAETIRKQLEESKLMGSDSVVAQPARQFGEQVKQAEKNQQAGEGKVKDAVAALEKFTQKHQRKGIFGQTQMVGEELKKWKTFLNEKDKKALKALEKDVEMAKVGEAMVQTVYAQSVEKTFDAIQAAELKRTQGLLDIMVALSDTYTKMSRVLTSSGMSIKPKVQAADLPMDLNDWAMSKRTHGKPCPWIQINPSETGSEMSSSSRDASGSMAISVVTNNPFARKNLAKMQWQRPKISAEDEAKARQAKKAREELEDKQEQARIDKLKFEKLHSRRKKKMQVLKRQRAKEQHHLLRAEQEIHEAENKEREKQIAVILEEKEQAEREAQEARAKEKQTQEELEARKQAEADREELLQALMRDKEQAEREKEELKLMLKEQKEARIHDDTFRGVQRGSISDSSTMSTLEQELKTPIVLDMGAAYSKIGFSQQLSPSLVVPNVVARYPHHQSLLEEQFEQRECFAVGATAQHLSMAGYPGMTVNSEVFCDSPQNWEDLEEMWNYMFNEMQVNMIDHPLLVTQPAMAPLALKSKMMEIMFEKFQVPALYVAEAPLLSAYAYGESSGLVVDIGHSSAQVVPLIDGFMLEARVRRALHLGGGRDTNRLMEFLEVARETAHPTKQADKDGVSNPASLAHSFVMAQGIKDRLAACTPSPQDFANVLDVLETVQGFVGSPGADPDANAGDGDGSQAAPLALQVELLKVGEVLFQPKLVLEDMEDSLVSVPEMIADVISKCDVDTRRTLLSNVFLSGGVCTMPGFDLRLQNELKQLIPHAASYIHVNSSEARYASWVGGSVITSLEAFQDSWIFIEDWREDREDALAKSHAKATREDLQDIEEDAEE